MVSSRVATALAGLAVSLLVSALAWWYFDTLLLFLLVPFVPFLLGGRGEVPEPHASECPRCGYRTRDPAYEYCPHDGTLLEEDPSPGRSYQRWG